MIRHFASAVLLTGLSWATVPRSIVCAFQRCVHFLDYEYTPLVYTLDRDGLRSYAVGTFHATISIDRLPRAVTRAIDTVPIFLNELSQTESFPMDLITDQEGHRLQLSRAAWITLERLFPSFNSLPATLRPAVVYRMYTEKILSDGVGAQSDADLLEVQLRRYAADHHKTLESLDVIRNLVTSLDEAVSAELLDWTLTMLNPNLVSDHFEKRRVAFRAGNADGLYELTRQSYRNLNTDLLYQKLVVDRNRQWVRQIVDAHARGPFALSIAAVHLGGPEGLLELLGTAGFRVRRLKAAAEH